MRRENRKESVDCKGNENRLVTLDPGSARSQTAGKWQFAPAVSAVKPTVIGEKRKSCLNFGSLIDFLKTSLQG